MPQMRRRGALQLIVCPPLPVILASIRVEPTSLIHPQAGGVLSFYIWKLIREWAQPMGRGWVVAG